MDTWVKLDQDEFWSLWRSIVIPINHWRFQYRQSLWKPCFAKISPSSRLAMGCRITLVILWSTYGQPKSVLRDPKCWKEHRPGKSRSVVRCCNLFFPCQMFGEFQNTWSYLNTEDIYIIYIYIIYIVYVKHVTDILYKFHGYCSLATTPEVASWPGPTCSRDILASFSGFRKHDLPWAIKNSFVSRSTAWWHTLHAKLNSQ